MRLTSPNGILCGIRSFRISRKSLKKSPDSAEADELGWRRIGFSEEKQESRRPDGAAAVEAIFRTNPASHANPLTLTRHDR